MDVSGAMTGGTSARSQLRRAVCPGSFDPVTNGHLDIIGRAANLYDEVVVAVLINQSKSSKFTLDERIDLLRVVTARYGNVRIDAFRGLLVDYCRDHDIPVIVKGLRAVSDFDYELQMAQMNRGLAGIDTMFMPTNPEYSFLASSLVKEIARWGGDVSALVPPEVLVLLKERRENGDDPAANGTDPAADEIAANDHEQGAR
jgi:pantetheine-phosphate adenylyltransferase